MRARIVWELGLCLSGLVVTAACPQPTDEPGPFPSTPEAACEATVAWAANKGRWHETVDGDSLKLIPYKHNHRIKRESIEHEGRVLALLVVKTGSVQFGRDEAVAGDSLCIYFRGPYPSGESPGNVQATFVRKRDARSLETVPTRIRIGTPHQEPEVDWIADYDSPKVGGMLPFPPSAVQGKIRKESQTACPGGCCTAKKPL
jgi:hypothetical protein